jgi:tRNA(Ile)-lysidine synthase
MAAMRHKNGSIIRPMLGITKKEIREYLKKNGLSYKTDRTNKEIPYLRNRIRNKLIPLLEKSYNPKIKQTLYDASLSIAEDYDFMEQTSREIYEKNKKLNVKNVLSLHSGLQRRIILKAIEEKKGSLKDIEMANVEEVLKIMKSTKSKNQIVKFHGLKFMRKGDRIFLSLIN